jgi:WD40 repeat protein
MKSTKLFFLGLLVSLSASGLQAAAALEQEVKEQGEAKEAAAVIDPASRARTLEILLKNFATKRGKSVEWPSALTKKIEEYTPTFVQESVTLGEEYGMVFNFFISPDERYLALVMSGNLVVYDLHNLQEKLNIPMRGDEVTGVRFFPQKNHYFMAIIIQPTGDSSRSLDKIRVYDLNNLQKALKVLAGTLLGHDNQNVIFKRFDQANYALYQLPGVHAKRIFPELIVQGTHVFSPDGRYLALQNRHDHTIMIYDLEDLHKEPKVLAGDAIYFSPDGNSVAVAVHAGNEILFYTLPNFVLEPRALEGRTIEFSPRGTYVVVETELEDGDQRQARLYQRNDLDTVLQEFTSQFNDFFFLPDDRHVAINTRADKGTINVYDIQNFDKKPMALPATMVALSPREEYVVAYQPGKVLDLYASDRLDQPLVSLPHNLLDKFSPRDRYLVTAGAHGGATVYNLLKLKQRAEKERAEQEPVPQDPGQESTSDWFQRFSESVIENVVPRE